MKFVILANIIIILEEFFGCFKVKELDWKFEKRLSLLHPLLKKGHQNVFKKLPPAGVAKVRSQQSQSLFR